MHEEKLDSVHDTVKTEMKSWSDIVKKSTTAATDTTVKHVQKVIKTVVEENERTKNVTFYGVIEERENETDAVLFDTDETVFSELDIPKPRVISASRLEKFKKDELVTNRSIKVTLASADEVKRVLSTSRKLRESTYYKEVYLAPDRNAAERLSHRKLVVEVKNLIEEEPQKYHYIRDNKVISIDKALSTG